MENNKILNEPISFERITMNNLPEREYWCEKFNCTSEELIEAVNTAGISSEAVEEYLKARVSNNQTTVISPRSDFDI